MTPQDHASAQSTSASLLKPELKKVLGNLNVHLEDELTRYRRQRRGQVPPPPPRIKAARLSQKQLDLISIQAREVPRPEAGMPENSVTALPPPPPNPFLKVSTETAEVATLHEPSAMAAASIAPAVDLEAPMEELAVHGDTTTPDGYLASSEELLKSLADEQEEDIPSTPSAPPYRPSRRNQILAPLKVGLLLLLLVSGVGIGYAIVNPTVLNPMLSWFKRGTEPSADTNSLESEVAVDESGNSSFQPSGPDLSTQEFVELDLKSLSTLDVGSQPVINPAASTPTVTTLPNSGTTLPAPSETAQPPSPDTRPAPMPVPTQATTSAIPAPSGSVPTTPAPVSSTTGRNYYVIADYTGDTSLAKAREVVSDAFVRNYKEGSRIQLGAFDNATAAQQLVQELQSQGLAGRLYGPTDE